LTNCKITTIRYYEEINLLPAADRTTGNQRIYGERHLTLLRYILHCRDLGFSIEDIHELIALANENEHAHGADAIAERDLKEVELKIERLNALRVHLSAMIGSCKQGDAQKCRVIEVLADHSQCGNQH
jgi:DNA-binding transcriptional MerR regulator